MIYDNRPRLIYLRCCIAKFSYNGLVLYQFRKLPHRNSNKPIYASYCIVESNITFAYLLILRNFQCAQISYNQVLLETGLANSY